MTGIESKSSVVILALTGVTVFNINGVMIYSMLSISILSDNCFDIDGERLKQLQERLQNVNYFIIDEKSMVRCWMLALIDMRLCQTFLENKSESFSDQSIIMFGDFG